MGLGWCRRIEGTDDYVTTVDIIYRGERIRAGFRFNISVPWCLTWLQSRHDPELLRMAAWHDYWLARGVDAAIAASNARIIARIDGASAQKSWRVFFSMLVWTAFDDHGRCYGE